MSKEQAKRKFRNDISALHRRAENEKTVLLLELDKQRKMLNDERFVNREKLDRRTFELFELKMKSREMFKEEWVAFEKREKDRWAALNARQAANDEMEMRLAGKDFSLDAPMGSDGDSSAMIEVLSSDQDDSPEELVADAQIEYVRREAIGRAVEQLDPRERLIIEARAMSEDPKTLTELGHELGVSRERARQLEARGLGKMKRYLLAQGDDALVPA